MKNRGQSRVPTNALTAKTGDEYLPGTASTVASDLDASSDEPTGANEVVGRTYADILYKVGALKTFGRFISECDPAELLGVTAYIILGIWGKSQGLVMPFWWFLICLAGYHMLLRPIARYLSWLADKKWYEPVPNSTGSNNKSK